MGSRAARVAVPAWLDAMPLDSADHVRMAWSRIGHPMIRGQLSQSDGLSDAEILAVIAVMRRRIRRAAWRYDVLLHGGS